MANLNVTSTTNSISVDFGATPLGNITRGTWRKAAIYSVRLAADRLIVISSDGSFEVAHTATDGALIIDSVDGVAPASLADLYSKLAALIA